MSNFDIYNVYTIYIQCIYNVYTMCIYNVYTMYNQNYWKSNSEENAKVLGLKLQ